jgi:UDP-2,3-diacylglucosamine pyrophosphatase LpxH
MQYKSIFISDIHLGTKMICGHIHHANIREIEGFQYMNYGDWVESCTALVEHLDGKWEIIRWNEQDSAS